MHRSLAKSGSRPCHFRLGGVRAGSYMLLYGCVSCPISSPCRRQYRVTHTFDGRIGNARDKIPQERSCCDSFVLTRGRRRAAASAVRDETRTRIDSSGTSRATVTAAVYEETSRVYPVRLTLPCALLRVWRACLPRDAPLIRSVELIRVQLIGTCLRALN